MSEQRGTPWDFKRVNPSPNGKNILEYGYVGEIAMGGPQAGECFIIINGKKLKLKGSYGGPPVWNNESSKAAIPFWTKDKLQHLAIIDFNLKNILFSKKEYGVIQLTRFENDMIFGIESPTHNPKKIEFNITQETYAKKLEIYDT